MNIGGIIALILIVGALVIALYACLIAASNADDQMEREAIKRGSERNSRCELPSDADR